MSYDIFFWRETPGASLDPERIFHELEDGGMIAGMVPIPLKTAIAAFEHHFPGIQQCEGVLEWKGEGGSFQVSFTFLDEKTVTLGTVYCGDDLVPLGPVVQRLAKAVTSAGNRFYDPNLVNR
jgi:hypothetical protein